MKQPPEIIWLKKDYEDPDYTIWTWTGDQPSSECDGVKYIKADAINKHHPRQVFKSESTSKKD